MLFVAQQPGAAFFHAVDEIVRHFIDDNDLFFRHAGEVVIEAAAVDDIAGGFLDIGGFINHNGRIARAGANRFLTGRHHGFHYRRPAGGDQHIDTRVAD